MKVKFFPKTDLCFNSHIFVEVEVETLPPLGTCIRFTMDQQDILTELAEKHPDETLYNRDCKEYSYKPFEEVYWVTVIYLIDGEYGVEFCCDYRPPLPDAYRD